MPKYRIAQPITGCLNAKPWPEVGEFVDLPAEIADDMVAAGQLETPADKLKVEKRPAAKRTETRKA